MLWLCRWNELVSMLINHSTRDGAVAIATAEREGDAPDLVLPVPDGAFRADVIDDGETLDDGKGGELDVVALEVDDGTLVVLAGLENGSRGGRCVSEADDADGKAVVCLLGAGHAGNHEAADLVWP